jgi:hypothetical protein
VGPASGITTGNLDIAGEQRAFGTDYYHRIGAAKADPQDNKRNETIPTKSHPCSGL